MTYAINPSSGELTLIDAVAAGGSSPRQFSLNKAGDKIAVSVQNDGWVVVFERDVKTGKVGKRVAVVGGLGEGGVVCTVWDEEGGREGFSGGSDSAKCTNGRHDK